MSVSDLTVMDRLGESPFITEFYSLDLVWQIVGGQVASGWYVSQGSQDYEHHANRRTRLEIQSRSSQCRAYDSQAAGSGG